MELVFVVKRRQVFVKYVKFSHFVLQVRDIVCIFVVQVFHPLCDDIMWKNVKHLRYSHYLGELFLRENKGDGKKEWGIAIILGNHPIFYL